MYTLAELYIDIEQRVDVVRFTHPNWLCRSGCDGCCHRLAEIPRLTAAEWADLRVGFTALPQQLREGIMENIVELSKQAVRPVVCPFLNRSTRTCLVYLYRPIACRTYGFYVERDKGLYCKDIASQVDSGELNNVVWGNQTGIDQRLKYLGEVRELTDWFAEFLSSP